MNEKKLPQMETEENSSEIYRMKYSTAVTSAHVTAAMRAVGKAAGTAALPGTYVTTWGTSNYAISAPVHNRASSSRGKGKQNTYLSKRMYNPIATDNI